VTALALPFQGRTQPALGRSFVLSASVHLLLLAVLFFGVRLQSHPPVAVQVELWEALPPPPAPVLEPPKPPPPAPKVEPEPEVKKPEIVEAAKPKPKPKPPPKAKPEPPKRDLAMEKRMQEMVAAEQKQLDRERQERELRELIARQQADATAKALATWTDKIRAKVRGNIIFDVAQLPGNPEAIFDVTLLPTGEVLSVQRRRSSGHAGYDEAVERAILKSSPLPKPEPASLFQRRLELKFRPQDK
jgi:colicin import membrane protein